MRPCLARRLWGRPKGGIVSEAQAETDSDLKENAEKAQDAELEKQENEPGKPSVLRLGPLQVIGSVLAAALGVQSSRNRERDFQQGRAGIFIVAGLIFTALFIGGVYTVVSVVLASR